MKTGGDCKFASNSLSKLYLNSELADVTFIFENKDDIQKVPANKSILASGSEVFLKMFSGSWKETDTVEIVDASPKVFQEFLKFFYSARVELTMENMKDVVGLADKYLILDYLKDYVESFLGQLTLDNICWGYQLAIITNNELLKRYCEEAICKYANDIFQSNTFLQCNQTVLKHILLLNALMCEESDIFEACLKWAKSVCVHNGLDENDPEMLKKQLGECFYLIRFGAMRPKVFVTCTVPYEKMFTRDELAHILYKSTDEFSSNKFSSCPRLFPEWDSNQVLSCQQGSNSTYYIQNPESVWFSTEKPLLLGDVEFWYLQHRDYSANLNFKLTINELSSFKADARTKVIFKGHAAITSNKTMMHLQRAIAIRPNKIYEIQLESSTNTSGYYCQSMQWPTEFKLNDNTVIKFHQNRSKIECRGLVSRFLFNEWNWPSKLNH